MDAKRFDSWTKNRASRLSRRDAMKLIGVGGAAAAIPALANDALAQGSCSLTIHGQIDGGPSTSTTFDGTLQCTLGPDGGFTQATFTQSGGGSATAAGRAIGRAIDFTVTLAGNQTLVFSGAGDQPLSLCQGAAAGVLSGPQPSDIGGWQTTGISTGSTGSSGGSGGTPGSGSGSGSGSTSSGSGSGSGSGSSGSGGGGGSTINCPSPQTACGQNCCPGGASCTDANQGLCMCPDGTEQCGVNCVESCPDNFFMDLDNCVCIENLPACIPNTQSCQSHDDCCSGYCAGGTCFDCANTVCGEWGCVDTSQDPSNCGSCFIQCTGGTNLCIGGVCTCIALGFDCTFDSDCCNGNCEGGACLDRIG